MERGKDLLYLSQADIADMNISMEEMIDLVEKVYIEKGKGLYQMPPKPALHFCPDFPGDFLHAMPAFIPGMDVAGMKFVAGSENARKLGYPYISGLYILNDVETGIPIAVMDCIWMTTVRTGAVTGLTAKYLANPESEVVGLLGTGVQGRIQVKGLMATMKNIKKVKVYDRFQEAAEAYVKEMSAIYPDVDFELVKDKEETVIGCDLLLSCIPSTTDKGVQFIKPDMIKEGCTALPVDALVLYTPEMYTSGIFSKAYTDDQGQFRHFQEMGYLEGFDGVPDELGEMIIGKVPGRESKEEKILTVNIGTGLADAGTARLIYDIAVKKGVGTILPL